MPSVPHAARASADRATAMAALPQPAAAYSCGMSDPAHAGGIILPVCHDGARADARSFPPARWPSLPTAVTIVTALGEQAARRGRRRTPCTSLSLDPPLMLACLDRGSRTLDVVRAPRALRGQRARPPTRSRSPARSPARRRTRRSSDEVASPSATGPDPRRRRSPGSAARCATCTPAAITRSRSATCSTSAVGEARSPCVLRRRLPRRSAEARPLVGDRELVLLAPLDQLAPGDLGRVARSAPRSRVRAGRCSRFCGGRADLGSGRGPFTVTGAPRRREVAVRDARCSRRSEELAAGARGAQGEAEDDQRRDGHDPGLAADDRERERALAVARAGRRSRAPRARARRPRRARPRRAA